MIEVLMMGAGAPMSTVGRWTQLALTGTKPRSRHYHTLVSVEDKLYLHGGSSGRGDSNGAVYDRLGDLWEYDIVNNTWLELKPNGSKPSSRMHHTLTSVGDKLYLHGGFSGGSNSLGDLWEYDIVNNTWLKLNPTGSKPLARSRHTLVGVGSKLYLHGGNVGGVELWEYDIVNNEWIELNPTGTTPGSRSNHTLVNVGSKLYLHGGGSTATRDELWEYDIVNNVWLLLEPIGSKPSGRSYHTLTHIGDKLYLHGGNVGGVELWEYDIVNNEWIELNPTGTTPGSRSYHTLVNVEDKLYLHGGSPGPTGDLWAYTISE